MTTETAGNTVKWARLLGIFEIVLAFASIASAAIAWRTLDVMQGQLEEMKSSSAQVELAIKAANRQATAIEEQAKDYKDSSKKQLRAYVYYKDGTLDSRRLKISLRNGGTTPAYDFLAAISLKSGSTQSGSRGIVFFEKHIHPIVLGPGDELTLDEIIEPNLSHLKASNPAIILSIETEYKDIFGDPHRSKTCASLQTSRVASPCSDGNEAD